MGLDGIFEGLTRVVPCGVVEIGRALEIRFVQLHSAELGDGGLALLCLSLLGRSHKMPSRRCETTRLHQEKRLVTRRGKLIIIHFQRRSFAFFSYLASIASHRLPRRTAPSMASTPPGWINPTKKV